MAAEWYPFGINNTHYLFTGCSHSENDVTLDIFGHIECAACEKATGCVVSMRRHVDVPRRKATDDMAVETWRLGGTQLQEE